MQPEIYSEHKDKESIVVISHAGITIKLKETTWKSVLKSFRNKGVEIDVEGIAGAESYVVTEGDEISFGVNDEIFTFPNAGELITEIEQCKQHRASAKKLLRYAAL